MKAPESEEDLQQQADDAWRAAGRRIFEQADAPEDVIYEQLVEDTPAV